MTAHEIVDRLHYATEAGRVDIELTSTEPGIVNTAICECGLLEPCCDEYCSIEDCDWLVY